MTSVPIPVAASLFPIPGRVIDSEDNGRWRIRTADLRYVRPAL
jgi:hypothetical protein